MSVARTPICFFVLFQIGGECEAVNESNIKR